MLYLSAAACERASEREITTHTHTKGFNFLPLVALAFACMYTGMCVCVFHTYLQEEDPHKHDTLGLPLLLLLLQQQKK